MARYLIDTHIFLWACETPSKLLARERTVLSDASIDVAVSVASFWELSIKIASGRLIVPGRARPLASDHFARAADKIGIPVLAIEAPDVEQIRQLPPVHGDPFDRLLIAQAQLRGRSIITRDAAFARYPGVRVFPAR